MKKFILSIRLVLCLTTVSLSVSLDVGTGYAHSTIVNSGTEIPAIGPGVSLFTDDQLASEGINRLVTAGAFVLHAISLANAASTLGSLGPLATAFADADRAAAAFLFSFPLNPAGDSALLSGVAEMDTNALSAGFLGSGALPLFSDSMEFAGLTWTARSTMTMVITITSRLCSPPSLRQL